MCADKPEAWAGLQGPVPERACRGIQSLEMEGREILLLMEGEIWVHHSAPSSFTEKRNPLSRSQHLVSYARGGDAGFGRLELWPGHT